MVHFRHTGGSDHCRLSGHQADEDMCGGRGGSRGRRCVPLSSIVPPTDVGGGDGLVVVEDVPMLAQSEGVGVFLELRRKLVFEFFDRPLLVKVAGGDLSVGAEGLDQVWESGQTSETACASAGFWEGLGAVCSRVFLLGSQAPGGSGDMGGSS